MSGKHGANIWSVLKHSIGKELSKITMPVVFNEPLSFLQRMTEYMEYARLLRMASEQDDAVERMKYVAGACPSDIYRARIISVLRVCVINFVFYIPLSRTWWRIGFAVSALASNWERLGKPFNPLLGETYEYQNSDFRVICEQVKFIWLPSGMVGHWDDNRNMIFAQTGVTSSASFGLSCWFRAFQILRCYQSEA